MSGAAACRAVTHLETLFCDDFRPLVTTPRKWKLTKFWEKMKSSFLLFHSIECFRPSKFNFLLTSLFLSIVELLDFSLHWTSPRQARPILLYSWTSPILLTLEYLNKVHSCSQTYSGRLYMYCSWLLPIWPCFAVFRLIRVLNFGALD